MSMQQIIVTKLIESQLRPDQVQWLQKYKNTPPEVLMQFILSPKGASVLQVACDALMANVATLETEIAQLEKKQP